MFTRFELLQKFRILLSRCCIL